MDRTPTDDTLAQLAHRDTEAFAALYRRHLHRVYSYLLSRVGHVQDAQDLTTQTFIAALQGVETYEARGTFGAWLLAIARRKAADHYRNHETVLSIEDIPPLAQQDQPLDKQVIQQLQMQEITLLLAKLNPERAEALRLRYFGDLKIREIATVMGKSEGSVKMLLARGLDDLRNMLKVQEEVR